MPVYLSPSYYSAGDCFSHNRTSSPSQRPRSVHYETPPIPPRHTVQNPPCQRNTLTLWRVRSPEYPTWLTKQPSNSPEWGRPNKQLIKTSRKRRGMTGKGTRLILESFLTPCQQSVSGKKKWQRGLNQLPVLRRSARPQQTNLNPTLIVLHPRWWCPVWTDTQSKGRRANTNTEIRWENYFLLTLFSRLMWYIGNRDFVCLSRRRIGGETGKNGEKITVQRIQTTRSPWTAQVSAVSCWLVTLRAETASTAKLAQTCVPGEHTQWMHLRAGGDNKHQSKGAI